MKRHEGSVRFTLRAPGALIAVVDAAARRRPTSASEYVRAAVIAALAREGAKLPPIGSRMARRPNNKHSAVA
jgi:hypothetical protein